ncbi:hypothetical protein ACFV0D_25240 [Streptomyces sp. NPDC059556]|uniref:hypothetical protein n=1 Tax=Streptomyces sp. NPDC059556 TaxID=3346863 RepID=UPI00368BA93E
MAFHTRCEPTRAPPSPRRPCAEARTPSTHSPRTPRAAAYLRRAAERAASLYANDTADRYYRDVDAARARLAHSHVLRRMGHFVEAAEALRLALSEFECRGDHDDTVLAAALPAEAPAKTRASNAARRTFRVHPETADTTPEPAADHYLALAAAQKVSGTRGRG